MKGSNALTALSMLSDEVGVPIKKMAEELSAYLFNGACEVELNQPCHVTAVSGATYRKEPFIGGERFRIVGAYIGSRDGLIMKMGGAGGGLYEMPAHKAEELLSGFDNIVNEFVENYGIIEINEGPIHSDSKRVEEEAHQKALIEIRMQDERFGSW